MSIDARHAFLPGPRTEQILPALVHRHGEGDYTPCPDPAQCPHCAPKLARREAFHAATGENARLLGEQLGEAQRLDASEATEQDRMRRASRPRRP
jgi:hypothetical protein